MVTIDELKREISKERSYAESDDEIANLGKEKKNLTKQLKSMRFKRKFSKYVPNVNTTTIKKVSSKIMGGIKKLGTEVNKVRERQDALDRKRRTDLMPDNKFKPKPRRVGLFK